MPIHWDLAEVNEEKEEIFITIESSFIIGERIKLPPRNKKDAASNYFSVRLQADFFRELEKQVIIPHLEKLSKDTIIWEEAFLSKPLEDKSEVTLTL